MLQKHMKVAFLTSEYPNLKEVATGGIGTSIFNLANGLLSKGIVVVILLYGQKEDGFFQKDGIDFYTIKNTKVKGLSWYFTRKKIARLINKLYSEKKIDIIEAPDWTGITAFMNLKVPLVIRFHGTDAYFCNLENRKQKSKNFLLEQRGILKGTAWVSPTLFAANLTKEIFGLNVPISVIPNGLRTEQFLNTEPDNFENGLILYIGTIIRKKGVFELAEIFKKVYQQNTKAKLILIGADASDIKTNNPSTWSLVAQTFDENTRDKVDYLGKVSYEAVQNLIKRAHVCVFPTFAETQGMVSIESMAMGKPVVNSNIGWANEIIVDGVSGFLVDPKNHQDYANKIIALLNNDDLRKSISVGARVRVLEQFNIDKIAVDNIEFYKSVLT